MLNTLAGAIFLAAVALIAAEGQAVPLRVDTRGSELCIGAAGCGTQVQDLGFGVTASFAGKVADFDVALGAASVPLGSIVFTCADGGTCALQRIVDVASAKLFLRIDLLAPFVASATFVADLTGPFYALRFTPLMNVAFAGSDVELADGLNVATFSVPDADGAREAGGPLQRFDLRSVVRLEGVVAAVPAPASLLLVGTPLVGLALARAASRRRHDAG